MMGLAPHLAFSLEAGELTYFKSAYDEDTYIHIYDDAFVRPDRILATVLFRSLRSVLDGNLEWTLIAADFLFPFLCTLAAAFLAGSLSRQSWVTALITLCLLFGQELLSFGSSAIWNFGVNLRQLRDIAPPWGSLLIPDYYTSYFGVFRTPEPQVSWIILFTYLGLLVRYLYSPEQGKRQTLWIFLFFHLVMISCYALVSLPLYGLTVLLLLFLWQRPAYGVLTRSLAQSLLVSFIAAVGIWSWFFFSTPNAIVPDPLFPSRLPSVTPSVVYSALFLLVLIGAKKQRIFHAPELLLGMIVCTLILVLMNQQVITGVMITTREWERNINYPLLVLGGALILTQPLLGKARQEKFRHSNAFGWIAIFFLAYVLSSGQVSVYKSWERINYRTLAQARVLLSAHSNTRPAARIVLDEPGLAPLLRVRLDPFPLPFVLDFTDVFRFRIADLDGTPLPPRGRERHQPSLFEFFARTGRTPSDVRAILRGEVERGTGFFVHFLFSRMDIWYPASDNRMLKRERTIPRLDAVASSYEDYLKSAQTSWPLPTLLLSKHPPEELPPNPIWKNLLLSSASVGQEAIYLYEQTRR
jgi:hypothetical protein